MLWQRITARRALTATPIDCRWGTQGTVTARQGRRSRTFVVREPEASFWEEAAREAGTAAPTVTVAEVREGDARWHPETLVSRLAELAADDELLVVFGSGGPPRHQSMIAGLRGRLPRHEVVAMHVRQRGGGLLRDAAAVERLLDAGSLPVVVTPVAEMHEVTAGIASYLQADRVLRVLRTTAGADLCQVWHRGSEPCVN